MTNEDDDRLPRRRRIKFRENTEERKFDERLQNLGEPSGISLTKKKRRKVRPEIKIKPHIGIMMGDAYNIINAEYKRLLEKQGNHYLDEEEIRRFNKLSETMVKIAREEREQENRDNPSEYSDEELAEWAEEAKQRLLEGK